MSFYHAPVPMKADMRPPMPNTGEAEGTLGPMLLYKPGERQAHCLGQLVKNFATQVIRWESLPDKTALNPADFSHWAFAMPNATWQGQSSPPEATEELFDEDGYPTEWALHRVAQSPWTDVPAAFEFIQSLWKFANMGYFERIDVSEGVRYRLSTAGWSGNEGIIEAMKQNHLLWSTWQSTQVGGHYEFLLTNEN